MELEVNPMVKSAMPVQSMSVLKVLFVGSLRCALCLAAASLTWAVPQVAMAQRGAPRADRPVARTDSNSVTAHQQLVEKTKQGRIDVYFAGDSITRRWGATDYPHLLANFQKNFHGWNAANFAWGGDSTQHILWRLQNGELEGLNPKVVVLLAGTNNIGGRPLGEEKADDIYRGIKAIVDTFREKVPDATVVVMGMLPRNDNLQSMPMIDRINEKISQLAEDEKIRYLNINDKLTDGDGRLAEQMSRDGLHLEEPAYQIWADALKPILTEVIGPPSDEDHAPPPTGDPSAARR